MKRMIIYREQTDGPRFLEAPIFAHAFSLKGCSAQVEGGLLFFLYFVFCIVCIEEKNYHERGVIEELQSVCSYVALV